MNKPKPRPHRTPRPRVSRPRVGTIAGRFEVCILAGGLSQRMGRDKARLRLGRRTLLGHIRAEAAVLGGPVRVIRRDAVPRCGPLGGVITALRTTRSPAVLLLACDMPFITAALLRRLWRVSRRGTRATFATGGNLAGFPLVLPRSALPQVEALVATGQLSLQQLAAGVDAARLLLSAKSAMQLANVNTPEEWQHAKARWLEASGGMRR